MSNNSEKRRPRKDRGRDHGIEIDLSLDALERMETIISDIFDIVRDIKEKVDALE